MTDEERASVVQEVLAVLRRRVESRKRQADTLESQPAGLPTSVTMCGVIRIKEGEAAACVSDIERWFSK